MVVSTGKLMGKSGWRWGVKAIGFQRMGYAGSKCELHGYMQLRHHTEREGTYTGDNSKKKKKEDTAPKLE